MHPAASPALLRLPSATDRGRPAPFGGNVRSSVSTRCAAGIAAATLILLHAASTDAHAASATGTSERAIAGRTTGLLELGETVTWSARHFGLRWQLTSRMVALDRPRHFRDAMVANVFRRFDHDHVFRQEGVVTHAVDVFDYTSPLGVLGRVADALLVQGHM